MKNITQPVTIVIPCYNYSHFLAASIESCLCQSHSRIELIVIDDGSTDCTGDIAQSYKEVNYYYQENQGLSAARNTGLKLAKSSYVVFLDADDLLESDCIDILLGEHLLNPDIAFCSGRCVHIDENDDLLRVNPLMPKYDSSYRSFLEGNYIACPASVMYRREVLMNEGGFDVSLDSCEDYDVYLRLTNKYSVTHLDKFVVQYRLHHGSMSDNGIKMLESSIGVLERQKPYIARNKELTKSYRQGLRTWRSFYGTLIISEILKAFRINDIRMVRKKIKFLFLYSPLLFAKCVFRLLLGKA